MALEADFSWFSTFDRELDENGLFYPETNYALSTTPLCACQSTRSG